MCADQLYVFSFHVGRKFFFMKNETRKIRKSKFLFLSLYSYENLMWHSNDFESHSSFTL